MRTTFLALLLLFTPGCTQESVTLQHISQIDTRTRGISFVDDGNAADLGMAGNTCRFDVGIGAITIDTDVAQGEDDVVTDAFDGSTVVVSRGGGFVVRQDFRNPDFIDIFSGRNVTDARLSSDGAFALISEDDACQVGWYSGAAEMTQQIVGNCPTSKQFDLQRDSSVAFFSDDEGISTYSAQGSKHFAQPAEVLRWDDASQALYASPGDQTVVAYNQDGAERWTVELPGRVTALDDMGDARSAIVMVEVDSTHGELVILDASTGQVRKTIETPSAARDIVVSQDGTTLAVILEGETHFFAVNIDL